MDVIKKVFIIILLGILPVFASDDLQALFNEGNQYYQAGEYEKAIKNYRSIIEQGYASGPLYFNLGNAYYKLNQLGEARLYYERAAKFLRNDEALQENLKLLSLRLVDQIEPPPKFILSVWWSKIVNLTPVDVLIWIVSSLFWLVLIIYSIRHYYRTRGKGDKLNMLYSAFLTILILFALISIQKIYNLETEQYAIIMKPSVTLLAEPKLGGTEVFMLHEGTKIEIERSTADWFEIRLEDGKTGWLEQSNLEII